MTTTRCVLVAAAVALAPAAIAQNVFFLEGGPMEDMDAEDIQLLTKNYREALEKLPDGHTNSWLNSKTGHSGTATPQKSFTRAGRPVPGHRVHERGRGPHGAQRVHVLQAAGRRVEDTQLSR